MRSYSISGAQWLSKNVEVPSAWVYSDSYSRVSELRAYGVIYTGYVEVLSNATLLKAGDVVYLNPINVLENVVAGKRYFWNTSDLEFLNYMDKIYSNEGSDIYKNTP
jgi:uncharacterized membrane protein